MPARSLLQLMASSIVLLASLANVQAPPHSLQEGAFRRLATEHALPEYPAASLARRVQGVAVAHVRTRIDGSVEHITVLQSPDTETATAVRDALAQWVAPVPPPPNGDLQRGAESTVTFYFTIEDGTGAVLNPEQMPGNEDVFVPSARRATGRGGAPMTGRIDPNGIDEVNDAALRQLLQDSSTTLLDVRERAPYSASSNPRAINIPAEELRVRAGAELQRAGRVVIDCAQERLFRCQAASQLLRERGFERVAIYIP